MEVRWEATFDLDGRPPKGYFTITPHGGTLGDRLYLVNGKAKAVVEHGFYTVRENVHGRPQTSYVVEVPEHLPFIDLADYHVPAPGEPMQTITRAEFDALEDDVEGLALTTRPYEPVHVQIEPAATWSLTHALGRYPEVTVLDAAGRVVWPDVEHPSISQVVITFGSPATGKAYLT